MTEKRIQFNNVIQNQLPSYVKEEFPLVTEFLKQYYISQEFKGASADLIQNIDSYIKLNTIKESAKSVTLASNISFVDETIEISSPEGTIGFPDSYGLLQIDSEIITYTGKTQNSFTGCIRGFSGITSYKSENKPEELVFSTSQSSEHLSGSEIINLSSLFLSEFFNKIKYQIAPGFENREFYSNVDKYLFLKQSKDFYSTRGTDASFKILFKVLYGEDVKVIRPQDYITKPSDSNYVVTNDMVVEVISGDPYKLQNSTLFQDEFEGVSNISLAYAPIYKVERIFSNSDREYYKLSFDAGYNRDLIVDGTLYGNFSIHPKTKLINQVTLGDTTLNVDSTVGFPSSGNLDVVYSNGTTGTISYTSKNINQFFGCSNITSTISSNSEIFLSVYARNEDSSIKVRITSVLNNVNITDSTYYYSKGDTGIIKTLGVNPTDYISNNWFFNQETRLDSSLIEIIDPNNKIYRISTKQDHRLRVGDKTTLISNSGVEIDSEVISIVSKKSFTTQVLGILDTNIPYTIKRNILNVDYPNYSNLSNLISNIQNVYKDSTKTLVASPSIPNYGSPLQTSDNSINFSGTFVASQTNPLDTFAVGPHNFYTGDLVYYTPGTNALFEEGLYFVKRESSTEIKLSKSRSNIYESIFVTITDTIQSNDNKIILYDFYQKSLDSQKLLREISLPEEDGIEYETEPGPTGIFINGVELLNYKSRDKIYYGPIQKIEVVSSGQEYDVINPPVLEISDPIGIGASGYCSVNGSLQEIRIIDSGFDYLEEPKVNITGGNGEGAKAKAITKLVEHQVSFNSQASFGLVNLSDNTISFSTYHKFRDAEKIIYRTEGQDPIGGLNVNSSYYVSVQDSLKVKLHKTFDDALQGVNVISLTSYGVGNHILESLNKKSVIASINIEESGEGYQNKKRTTHTNNVSTSLNQINIDNHGFNSGEIVKYTTTGTEIGGLSSNTKYYVTKVDENNFKLSILGSQALDKDFYYLTKQYINFTSTGSGVHVFNYPEIEVNVVGRVGVSSIGGNSFNARVQPIFRGQITSVHLEGKGVGYGSSEIINFEREPLVTLNSGSGCKLLPIINDGKISEVLVDDQGSGYNSPPNLTILTEDGSGVGAVLTPIIENGRITSINIIESGIGYDKNKTSIVVTPSGSGCKFKSILKTWNVNLFKKYFDNISDDDGVIFYNPISKYGLQYSHIYSPRKLREKVYSRESGDNILYGKFDLTKSNSVEVSSTAHSPILGWAYDGNPIYGPYGYSKKDGGVITQIKSGYKLNPQSGRPPFPVGFFVEDYEHFNVDDDTILDKHNGRFCVTPDFPNGTYAYFTTIEPSADKTKFNGYRIPEFPYVIGNIYKSTPNKFNFSRASNQDDIDLNETNWVRNTSSYNLDREDKTYSYITLPNNLNQTVDVKYASPGSVDEILINYGGTNYKVNDRIVFEDTESGGYGLSAKVSRVSGKDVNRISVASTVVYGNEIYPTQNSSGSFTIQSDSPYSLANGNIVNISGLTTTNILPQGFYSVSGITTNTFAISNPTGLANVSTTGIVTYISVSGNIAYSNVRENDLYLIGDEKVKILNVDRESSRLRILRAVDGTVGTSHSYSDILYELPRRFVVRTGASTSFNYKLNKEIYFNPADSLGIGTISGVGIGSTIIFSNPGVGITQVFIPTKTIYLPNHNLETGDSLTYSTNGGEGILVSSVGIGTTILTDQSTLYVAKINNDLIGISTVKVGIGSTGAIVGISSTTSSSTTLYLNEVGTGNYHSFKTNYQSLVGQVSRNIVTVSTASSHGLSEGDNVFISVNSGVSTTYILKYDDYNRKLLVNPRSFTSNDVDSIENTITLIDHKFKTGQKVSYATTESVGELVNNGIYYAVVHDKDKIKLSSSYYDSTKLIPEFIGIGSTAVGTLSPVNPPLRGYKNSSIIFDVSDESLSFLSGSTRYPAFKLNFYLDSNFTQIFDTSKTTNVFEVKREGRTGIDTGAKVSINITDTVPKKLFYKLDPVYNANLPIEKSEINIDSDISSNNQIEIVPSLYEGNYNITSVASTTFTYDIVGNPELPSYDNTNSTISYETDSSRALGSISKIDIITRGQNYYSLPKLSRIISTSGSGAILEPQSNKIGIIKKTKLNDIGFDFPTDRTLKPNLSFPQILELEPLNSIESIGISSVGIGYNTSPKLIVIDGKTNRVISDVDLEYTLGNSQVKILTNTYSLNDVEPIIIPTQNSNGVGISSISFDPVTKNVTVKMSVGFSTENTFPFSIGDRVLIENISVGIASTGVGFNSKDYGYQLFTLNSVDENIGGIGTVSYNLGEYLEDGQIPGTFDIDFSSGRIIPEKYFPIFKTTLKQNDFFVGEEVRYLGENNPIGFVEGWDRKSYKLRVVSKQAIENRELQGVSSKTQGLISSSISFNSHIDTGAYSKTEKGSELETGILNNSLQRIQDNFYYQNFSYSLKSRVPYDTWEDVVGTLNHTAGFKKFSDYQLESSQFCGIATDSISTLESFTNLDSVVDLNCVYDFDLVRENSITIGSEYLSDTVSFKNKILSDYFELISNRVLSIDDISSQFNSDPRYDIFVEVDRFRLSDVRAKKYITYIRDRRFLSEKQMMIVTLLHDDTDAYLNQYARLESYVDLGSFDFRVEGDEGVLLFYPNKYRVNDYNISHISYNLKNSFTGLGTTSIGGIVDIETSTTNVSAGSTTNIINLGSSYISSKILVEAISDNGNYQYDELNLVTDGNEVYLCEYGQLLTTGLGYNSGVGFGTYVAYLSGSDVRLDFATNPGIGATVNVMQVSIANTSTTGIGTVPLRYARIQATTTNFTPSISPVSKVVSEHLSSFYGSYYIVQVSDITNNRHEFVEILSLDDEININVVEYGIVTTYSNLGEFSVTKSGTSTRLEFVPIPNIEVEVKVFANHITDSTDDSNFPTTYNEDSIRTNGVIYYGTESEFNTAFELNHKNFPIFQRTFSGEDSNIVDSLNDTIRIPGHFFVSGEEVTYSYGTNTFGGDTFGSEPISITDTDFGVGIGTTNKLPSKVYIVKIDQNTVKLAKSAQDALLAIPSTLDITSTGIGVNHKFTSVNQNAKCLIAIDNIIQSPVVSIAITTKLSESLPITEDILFVDDEKQFFSGDLIKINDEILRIRGVGIGSTNSLYVRRSTLGTNIVGHSTGSVVSKINGSYNIIDNTIYFSSPPYGNIPFSSPNNPPDERDWVGVATNSTFQGRVFLRSGIEDTSNETYHKNYIFDDISTQFTGSENTFTLTSNNSNTSDISNENGIILINDIFQEPGLTRNYTLSEDIVGVTSIRFVGSGTSTLSDINTSALPRGGIIVSVGSTEGFGYQPLVSAGATAIVSAAGTISQISIGNSGSGYRSAISTPDGVKPIVVRVGVSTSSLETPNIEFIGTATVSNGTIIGIAITNPGIGYTSTNPPYVVIDPPLSYSSIPLVHSSPSLGIGVQATIDIVVGQGSSVIDFEINNLGYNYSVGDTLTVETNGAYGIPTISGSTLRDFEITVQQTFNDKFNGWTVGELQVFDKIERFFNGQRTLFPISYLGNQISLYTRKGSPVSIQDTLLVFINEILQVPGESYIFPGGNKIEFTEPPKEGDTCKILFYKGSGEGVDVIFTDVLETIKIGDELRLTYDSYLGQPSTLLEDLRTVSNVLPSEVDTNPYFGPGNTQDGNLYRPVNWCRQTADKLIDGIYIGKDRELYEPSIIPSANLINSLGVGSTIVYVDNLRPYFDAKNESQTSLEFQNNIVISSNEIKVSASATAVVSTSGTISSIIINDGGFGYDSAPEVSIQSPTGITTIRSTAISSISSGIVTSISVVGVVSGYSQQNPPVILLSPPSSKKETNKVNFYEGDSGVIVGFGVTIGGAYSEIVMDLYIPNDSPLKDPTLTGVPIVQSSLKSGDYFVVYDSNIGIGTTSFISVGLDGLNIGISTHFIDNVYQVSNAETIVKNVEGVGNAFVRRIFTRISGIGTINFSSSSITFDSTLYKFDNVGITSAYVGLSSINSSNYLGNYSWGKIGLRSRTKEINYNPSVSIGTTVNSTILVERLSPLKYSNYII